MQRFSSPLCLIHQCRSYQLDGVECMPWPLCGPGGGAIRNLDTYLSVCVILRNTVVVRKPSLWWVIFVSRNERVLSVSSSTVNWMVVLMECRCDEKR